MCALSYLDFSVYESIQGKIDQYDRGFFLRTAFAVIQEEQIMAGR
jgi:hypothetical protein